MATLVTVNGQYQNIWDADTKVDKFKGPYDTFMRLYGTDAGGTPKIFKAAYNTNQYGNSVLYAYSDEGTYLDDGSIRGTSTGAVVTAIPKKPAHATPKKWVEDKLALKLAIPTSGASSSAPNYILGMSSASTSSTYRYKVAAATGDASKNAVAKYNSNGNLVSGTPIEPDDAAPKNYVDSNTSKLYRHDITLYYIVEGYDPYPLQSIYFYSYIDNIDNFEFVEILANKFVITREKAIFITSPITWIEGDKYRILQPESDVGDYYIPGGADVEVPYTAVDNPIGV